VTASTSVSGVRSRWTRRPHSGRSPKNSTTGGCAEPINYFDSGRAIGMRCEPGVGGTAHRGLRGGHRRRARARPHHGLGAGVVDWPGPAPSTNVSIDIRFEPGRHGHRRHPASHDRPRRARPRWHGLAAGSHRNGSGRGVFAARPSPARSPNSRGWPSACSTKSPRRPPAGCSRCSGLASPDPLPDGPDPLAGEPEGDYGHPWIEFRVGNCSLMLFPNGEQTPPERP